MESLYSELRPVNKQSHNLLYLSNFIGKSESRDIVARLAAKAANDQIIPLQHYVYAST
jgi:hypothetical protein